MNTKTILFPTDFSEASQAAFRYAVDFAQQTKAKLLIVHVHEPTLPIIGGEIAYLPLDDTDSGLRLKTLQALVPEVKTVEYAHRLLEGDPASEIVHLAQAERVELIVLGTHGRSGIERLLMGSTAEQILRRAPCPVLAVKEPAPVPAAT
jgi:universal stress protein A